MDEFVEIIDGVGIDKDRLLGLFRGQWIDGVGGPVREGEGGSDVRAARGAR